MNTRFFSVAWALLGRCLGEVAGSQKTENPPPPAPMSPRGGWRKLVSTAVAVAVAAGVDKQVQVLV
ncbi:hypothetical protein [Corynebacterium propinquum]